jgi:hypothetical protein
MILAHLRGLLKPGYSQGVASVIREELVLQALSQETEAHNLLSQAQMTSSMLAAYDPSQRPKMLRQAIDNLRMGSSLLRMESYDKIVRQVKAHSVEANIAAFKLLEHTNVFELLKKTLDKETQNAGV